MSRDQVFPLLVFICSHLNKSFQVVFIRKNCFRLILPPDQISLPFSMYKVSTVSNQSPFSIYKVFPVSNHLSFSVYNEFPKKIPINSEKISFSDYSPIPNPNPIIAPDHTLKVVWTNSWSPSLGSRTPQSKVTTPYCPPFLVWGNAYPVPPSHLNS